MNAGYILRKVFFFACLATAFQLCGYSQVADKNWVKQQYEKYKKKDLIWSYDKFRDETTIITKPEVISKPGVMNMMLARPGSEMETPFVSFTAGIYHKGMNRPENLGKPILAFNISANGWKQLKSDRQVRIMFEGGDVILLGTANYDANVNRGTGYQTNELLMVEIELKDLSRMSDSQNVMIQIGRLEIAIKEKQLKSLQPLIAELKSPPEVK